MSYSCTVKANISLEAIEAAVCTGEASNRFEHNGNEFFIERGRENSDGAITATIYKMFGRNNCRKSGSLRIEPDGVITRPKWMQKTAYKDGFIELSKNYPPFMTDINNEEFGNPNYPEFCSAFTNNGVDLGDIWVMNKSA